MTSTSRAIPGSYGATTSTTTSGEYGRSSTGQMLWTGSTWARSDQRDLRQALSPLIRHLRRYDRLRTNLEENGGKVGDLDNITQVLNQPFRLMGAYRAHEVRLTDQTGLRAAVADAGGGDAHLQVRMLGSKMPAYYLARVRQDYWAQYSLVVQDLYRSPGYPMVDDRFVSLMRAGKETYYLRLSQFRVGVGALLGPGRGESEGEVDHVLHTVGRHVFDCAWHEDQRPGMLSAHYFDLPWFIRAIELLYLALGSELCAVRNVVDATVLGFFRDVYEQPAIIGLLELLGTLDGESLNAIPARALTQYARLSTAFGRFLQTEVTWGAGSSTMPLYKPVFADFGRLEHVAPVVLGQKKMARARLELEATAEDVIRVILEGCSQADLPE